jgi:hypothetical protein
MNFEITQPPVAAPGVPKNYPDAKQLVTEDCIKPNTTEQIDDR